MYYKVLLKDSGITFRYIVLADDPAEARKFAREYHREHYNFVDIERVTVSPEIIDECI